MSCKYQYHIIQIYSGIKSGRVLDGELLYTKIVEINLFAFAYRLFHEGFSSINGAQPGLKSLRVEQLCDCLSLHLVCFMSIMFYA